MVRSRIDALAEARKQKTNVPGSCQKTTRGWFNAPSAGDRDHDGDADANDGWLSEPVSARHPGDRHPPPGVPLYFKNRSRPGFGHRCISDDYAVGGAISTDMSNGRYKKGVTGRATIPQIEDEMGLIYIGWSNTITGKKIPSGEKPPVKPTKPPVKPSTPSKPPVKPTAKKSIRFEVATNNLMAIPAQKTITKGLDSVKGCAIIGFQEASLPHYKKAILRKYPTTLGIGTAEKLADDSHNAPISFAKSVFERVSSGPVKLYDGASGISLTRRLTKAVLKHRASGIKIGVVNFHGPVVKADQRQLRLKKRAEAKRVVLKQVDTYLNQGLAVQVTCDANDKVNWFGRSYNGHKVTCIGGGIDKILLIDGKKHAWKVVSRRVVKTPSDHDTLRAEVQLTEK